MAISVVISPLQPQALIESRKVILYKRDLACCPWYSRRQRISIAGTDIPAVDLYAANGQNVTVQFVRDLWVTCLFLRINVTLWCPIRAIRSSSVQYFQTRNILLLSRCTRAAIAPSA